MKRYLLKFTVVFILSLTSCDKYLQLDPLDKLASSTFWKTKADFDMGLTANYALLQNDYWGDAIPSFDNITDNSYGQNDKGNMQVVTGDINPNTGGYIPGIYYSCYRSIARNNIFLQQLAAYKGTNLSDANKKQYEAEIRFLRAYFYFQLYFFYGDVPLVLEPVTIETQDRPKNSAAEILTQILVDLDFAIANLNPVAYSANMGHATKSSAQALKARVLIFTAYGNSGSPDIATLTQVRDLCLQIQPLYTLSLLFEDIFKDSGQKNNPEIIFSANYLNPDSRSHYDLWYGAWLDVSPLKSFVNAFECTDGLPWGISPLTNLNDQLVNRDPRLNKSIFKGKVDFGNGNSYPPTSFLPTGFGAKKFLSPGLNPVSTQGATMTQTNAVKFRLGEILLMYAEAQNEIVGPDASVYKAMTDLRARVQMPPFPAGLTKIDMRERIRHERRIELAFEEGLRYFDLKRWRIANAVLNTVTDGLLHYNFNDKFYKWPLPQAEIDKSKGILIQNPDY